MQISEWQFNPSSYTIENTPKKYKYTKVCLSHHHRY